MFPKTSFFLTKIFAKIPLGIQIVWKLISEASSGCKWVKNQHYLLRIVLLMPYSIVWIYVCRVKVCLNQKVIIGRKHSHLEFMKAFGHSLCRLVSVFNFTKHNCWNKQLNLLSYNSSKKFKTFRNRKQIRLTLKSYM